MTDPTSRDSAAVLSPCGRYRYTLERAWAPNPRYLMWVMLNPSTADATQDDATIRRCIRIGESHRTRGREMSDSPETSQEFDLVIQPLPDGQYVLGTCGASFRLFSSAASLAASLRDTADRVERNWAQYEKERGDAR